MLLRILNRIQSLLRMAKSNIAFGALLLLLVVHCSAAGAGADDGDSERNCPKFWVDGTFVGMGRKHLSEI